MYSILTNGRLPGTGLVVQRWDIHKSGFINHDPGWAQQFMFENGFLSSLCFASACLICAKKIFDNGKYNCNLFGIFAVVIFALSARDMWIVVLPLIMLLKLHHQSNSGMFTWSFGWFCEKDKQIIYLSDALARLFAFRLESFQNRRTNWTHSHLTKNFTAQNLVMIIEYQIIQGSFLNLYVENILFRLICRLEIWELTNLFIE